MVRRRLEQEGKDPVTFELKPRKWGTRRPGTPFVDHNGYLYLEVIFLKPGKVEFIYRDMVIPREAVQGLKEPNEAEQGGLDNKVIIRTFKADSIKAVTIDKMRVQL
jgi:hypothetical protein